MYRWDAIVSCNEPFTGIIQPGLTSGEIIAHGQGWMEKKILTQKFISSVVPKRRLLSLNG